MDQAKMDRRIGKTRNAIRDTFTELIEEIGFDAITVRNLTEKANINRSTFYLHYRDKYDLLEKSEEEILKKLEELSESAKKLTPTEIDELFSKNKPLPFIVQLIAYFQENASFLKVILGPKGDTAFQDKIKNVMKKRMEESVLLKFDKNHLQIPTDVFMAYIVSAHFGAIHHWLNSGMQQSPNEIAQMIFNMTFHGPMNAMGIKKG